MKKAIISFFAVTASCCLLFSSCGYNPFELPKENTVLPLDIMFLDTVISGLRCELKSGQLVHEGYTINKQGAKQSYGAIKGFSAYAYIIGKGGKIEYQSKPLSIFTNVSEYYNYDVEDVVDGGYKIWDVENSNAISGFKDSIKSSRSQIKATSPLNAADISRSSGLTIIWDPVKDSGEAVTLVIYNINDGPSVFFESLSDNGSFVVPDSSLSKIPDGQLVVQIMRSHYKIGSVPNSDKYAIIYYTEHDLQVNLVK